jgi:hypothetical protein
LLTDDDLNRLERYVVDKNRLRNRYLHGWGVACGLEVVCDVCDPGHVVVRTGYALSPCGDDIIVCDDQSVDICALINTCEPRQPVCEGPYDAPPRDCSGGITQWVLAICYDERPVRGITALLGAGDTTVSARCKCGGSAGCGCGGSSAKAGTGCSCGNATQTATAARRTYQPQCEPTQTCETFRFMVYPAPKEIRIAPAPQDGGLGSDLIWAWLYANRTRFGPLIERILCCLTRAMELRQAIREGKTLDRAFAVSAYLEYATALGEFAADFAIHRCAFASKAQTMRDEARTFDWDSPNYQNDAARIADLYQRVTRLDITWAEIVSECFCSALLPACPPPVNTNCVPLAAVTITANDCRVAEICNWSERRLLISWPTIGYWLSWLPWKQLRSWIANVCCGSDPSSDAVRLMSLLFGTVFTNLKTNAAVPVVPPAGMAAQPRARAEVGDAELPPNGGLKAAFDSENLLAYLLSRFEKLRTEGAEANNEPGWAELVARYAAASPVASDIAPDPKITTLMKRLDLAEAALKQQEAEIAELRNAGGRD